MRILHRPHQLQVILALLAAAGGTALAQNEDGRDFRTKLCADVILDDEVTARTLAEYTQQCVNCVASVRALPPDSKIGPDLLRGVTASMRTVFERICGGAKKDTPGCQKLAQEMPESRSGSEIGTGLPNPGGGAGGQQALRGSSLPSSPPPQGTLAGSSNTESSRADSDTHDHATDNHELNDRVEEIAGQVTEAWWLAICALATAVAGGYAVWRSRRSPRPDWRETQVEVAPNVRTVAPVELATVRKELAKVRGEIDEIFQRLPVPGCDPNARVKVIEPVVQKLRLDVEHLRSAVEAVRGETQSALQELSRATARATSLGAQGSAPQDRAQPMTFQNRELRRPTREGNDGDTSPRVTVPPASRTGAPQASGRQEPSELTAERILGVVVEFQSNFLRGISPAEPILTKAIIERAQSEALTRTQAPFGYTLGFPEDVDGNMETQSSWDHDLPDGYDAQVDRLRTWVATRSTKNVAFWLAPAIYSLRDGQPEPAPRYSGKPVYGNKRA